MTTLPWYIAGPLLGLMVPAILILREKQLGISSSFRYVGSYILPNLAYFKYNRLKDAWQLHFAIGIIVSALLFVSFDLTNEPPLDPSKSYGVQAVNVYDGSNWLLFLLGGLSVGFGARYAGGCTAGHCIMGNAQFAKSSIVSTCAFFIGGLLITHFVLPQLLDS